MTNSTFNFSTPCVMGILNITPDSFSDAGAFLNIDDALKQTEKMIEEGASIIDIGGESTRPGATTVSCQVELDRVLPVIEGIKQRFDIPISIDTSKPEVMTQAAKVGADMINDVNALRLPGAVEAAIACHVPVCIMHMQGEPGTMQHEPYYDDVIKEVSDFLAKRIDVCLTAGMKQEHLIIDPGFGFGKTVEHNLTIIKNLLIFTQLGFPLLLGVSRKFTIGKVCETPVHERLAGSLSLTAIGIMNGASIIRTHDVKFTVDAVKMAHAVLEIS